MDLIIILTLIILLTMIIITTGLNTTGNFIQTNPTTITQTQNYLSSPYQANPTNLETKQELKIIKLGDNE